MWYTVHCEGPKLILLGLGFWLLFLLAVTLHLLNVLLIAMIVLAVCAFQERTDTLVLHICITRRLCFHLHPRWPRDYWCGFGPQAISQRLHFSWDVNSKTGDSFDKTSQFWLWNNALRDKSQKSPRNASDTRQVLRHSVMLYLQMNLPYWKVLESFENKVVAPLCLSVWL